MYNAGYQHHLFYERVGIMDRIHTYLLAVTSCAVLCGLMCSFFPKKNMLSEMIKLLCGLVMTIIFISPWTEFSFSDYNYLIDGLKVEASSASDEGKAFYNDTYRSIIIEETQTYILDKALNLGLTVEALVELCDTDPPKPEIVVITGNASPILREKLTNQLSTDLDIPREQLIWK